MFIKDTFKFIVTNKRLILVASAVSALLGVFVTPASLIPFMFNYRAGQLANLGAALSLLTPLNRPVWLLLLIPAAFIFTAVMFGLAEHKMRVGNYGFGGFLQRINFGVTALIVPFVIMCLVYSVWLMSAACILVFIEYICFGLIGSAALSQTVTVIFALLLLILLILMLSLVLLWPSVTLVSGYGIMDSWYYQLKLLTGNIIRFAVSASVAFFINGAFVTTFGLFLSGVGMALVNIACITFSLVYLVGLSMTAYFRLSDTPRKDIKKKYYQ